MSPPPICISLTWPELSFAAKVGMTRECYDRKAGYGHRPPLPDPRMGWATHIEGAAGEMAIAKWADVFWAGAIGNLTADDVGELQVRTAQDRGRLILHPWDPDDRVFVSVTGMAPHFKIMGWLMARDGKRLGPPPAGYWEDPTGKNRHAFFVPDGVLRDMRELKLRGVCT